MGPDARLAADPLEEQAARLSPMVWDAAHHRQCWRRSPFPPAQKSSSRLVCTTIASSARSQVSRLLKSWMVLHGTCFTPGESLPRCPSISLKASLLPQYADSDWDQQFEVMVLVLGAMISSSQICLIAAQRVTPRRRGKQPGLAQRFSPPARLPRAMLRRRPFEVAKCVLRVQRIHHCPGYERHSAAPANAHKCKTADCGHLGTRVACTTGSDAPFAASAACSCQAFSTACCITLSSDKASTPAAERVKRAAFVLALDRPRRDVSGAAGMDYQDRYVTSLRCIAVHDCLDHSMIVGCGYLGPASTRRTTRRRGRGRSPNASGDSNAASGLVRISRQRRR
eukprot:m.172247 g.172247  ORF g.172247 m.172247 type:complete len:339 (-) comp9943_c2_seq8:43-1059(-)